MPIFDRPVDPAHLPAVNGTTSDPLAIGVLGQNDKGGIAVNGVSVGVGEGFLGGTDPKFKQHAGVFGESDQLGVIGVGIGDNATGVFGTGHFGVRGESPAGRGFLGGTDPKFKQHAGVFGESDQQGVIGVATGDGTGVYGTGGKWAGRFEGNVEITGNLNMSSDTSDVVLGDVAEGFSTQDSEIIEPGTVVVLTEHGLVRPADEAYDKRVAGVVSGAGAYRPAIVLDKRSSQASQLPVALVGKVCCKVDAQYSPIAVGDLLTTSPTPGHAMNAVDPLKAFGAVIGKALRPLEVGQGLIPILIGLQ